MRVEPIVVSEDIVLVSTKFDKICLFLDEYSRRMWCAVEAASYGYGGILLVHKATGVSKTTIAKGIRELNTVKKTSSEVVNPEYRRLDGQVRRLAAQHAKRLVDFDALHVDDKIEPDKMEAYEKKKAALLLEVQTLAEELVEVKQKRKETRRHIAINALPAEEQFQRLAMPRKQLLDTIKMIAYRAETAMANILRPHLSRPDEARKLLQTLYKTEVDLLPNEKDQTLTVQLHHLVNHVSEKAIQELCDELNATEIIFPGTNLRLIYKLGAN